MKDGDGDGSDNDDLYNRVIGDGTHNIQTVVELLLRELAFKYTLAGTEYLKEAIVYRYRVTGTAAVNCNEVYLYVAERMHKSACSVEHDIRNTIQDCALFGKLRKFYRLLRDSATDAAFYAPTNGELMCDIVGWLELEKSEGMIRD